MTQLHSRGLSRRSLFRHAAVAAATGAAASVMASNARAQASGGIQLKQGDVILFQGDSITDAGRNKENLGANNVDAFGHGYALMAASRLMGVHASLALLCYNRGISGNKVPDLDARWQQDTLELRPAVLSILIGVNDLWHKLNGNYSGSVADYEAGFTALLKRTREALPDTALVICEPFALRCGAVNDAWYPEFDERRAAARRVATAAGAVWVPFQQIFDDAISETTPPAYWAADGVHPTMAGHALMARAWLDVTGLG